MLANWHAVAAKERRDRVVLAKFVWRMQHLGATRCFVAWRQHAHAAARQRQLMKRVMGRIVNAALARCVTGAAREMAGVRRNGWRHLGHARVPLCAGFTSQNPTSYDHAVAGCLRDTTAACGSGTTWSSGSARNPCVGSARN